METLWTAGREAGALQVAHIDRCMITWPLWPHVWFTWPLKIPASERVSQSERAETKHVTWRDLTLGIHPFLGIFWPSDSKQDRLKVHDLTVNRRILNWVHGTLLFFRYAVHGGGNAFWVVGFLAAVPRVITGRRNCCATISAVRHPAFVTEGDGCRKKRKEIERFSELTY